MMINIFKIADDMVELINKNLLDEAFEYMKETVAGTDYYIQVARKIKEKDPKCAELFSKHIRVVANRPIIVTEEDQEEQLEKERQLAEDDWAEELIMMVRDKNQIGKLHKLYPVIKSISSKVDSFPSLLKNIRNRNSEVADIINRIACEVQVNDD
jgi:hypothetical protein